MAGVMAQSVGHRTCNEDVASLTAGQGAAA